jgi:uncharacterized protein YukE
MVSHRTGNEEETARLQRQLSALPDPLPGDPGALRRLAADLLGEAGKVQSLSRREAAMPSRITFESDGARRLYANMSDVAVSYSTAQHMLEHAAQTIRQRADSIEHSQNDWNQTSQRLVNAISRLA